MDLAWELKKKKQTNNRTKETVILMIVSPHKQGKETQSINTGAVEYTDCISAEG